MKRVTRWLRSRTGLIVMVSLLVAVALFTLVGLKLGWWSLTARYMTGTVGGGVEVELLSYTALAERGRNVIKWKTGIERNCQGFHLYRAKSGTNNLVQVNSAMIPGHPPAGSTYRFDDIAVTPGVTYDYHLVGVGLKGEQWCQSLLWSRASRAFLGFLHVVDSSLCGWMMRVHP